MLLAQISDLHIKRPGALAYRRVDTGAYLARCVAALNALEPRPDAVIMTGDLVDQGDPEQYEHLRHCSRRCRSLLHAGRQSRRTRCVARRVS